MKVHVELLNYYLNEEGSFRRKTHEDGHRVAEVGDKLLAHDGDLDCLTSEELAIEKKWLRHYFARTCSGPDIVLDEEWESTPCAFTGRIEADYVVEAYRAGDDRCRGCAAIAEASLAAGELTAGAVRPKVLKNL